MRRVTSIDNNRTTTIEISVTVIDFDIDLGLISSISESSVDAGKGLYSSVCLIPLMIFQLKNFIVAFRDGFDDGCGGKL
jgi:hypothetical protein